MASERMEGGSSPLALSSFTHVSYALVARVRSCTLTAIEGVMVVLELDLAVSDAWEVQVQHRDLPKYQQKQRDGCLGWGFNYVVMHVYTCNGSVLFKK